jgi:hypothetical protein
MSQSVLEQIDFPFFFLFLIVYTDLTIDQPKSKTYDNYRLRDLHTHIAFC